MPVAVVGHHIPDDFVYLLFQFFHKLCRIIFLMFYIAQFLLPDAREFATLEQFFTDGVDEFDTRRRGNEVLAFALDVVAFEEGLDDACPGRWPSDAILLEGCAQGVILDKLARRLHCPQQGCLGIELGRCGPFLGERGQVGSAFSLREYGQRALLVVLLLLLVIGTGCIGISVLVGLGIDQPPAGTEYGLARHLELDVLHLAQHGGGGKLAVGIEGCDETPGDEVVDVALHVAQVHGGHTRGDDGMVVGHLGGVEHLLRLGQLLPGQCLHERLVASESSQYGRTFGIDIITQELGVHTRIGGEFALVESLYDVECHLCTHAVFAVAVHLQRGEVVERFGRLCSVFLLHRGDGEGFACNGLQKLLTLLLHIELALGGREDRITIGGRQDPIGFWLEVFNLLLAVDNEGERGCLHPSDAEHLPVLSVFEGIEPGGIHAENPVADGTAESGEIEGLILLLVLQLTESLADGLIGHRRNPESLHGTFGLRFLHHPSLDEFSLLSGVTAVDNAVGSLHQSLDDGKLLGHSLVVDEFDAEALRNHRQCREAPVFP